MNVQIIVRSMPCLLLLEHSKVRQVFSAICWHCPSCAQEREELATLERLSSHYRALQLSSYQLNNEIKRWHVTQHLILEKMWSLILFLQTHLASWILKSWIPHTHPNLRIWVFASQPEWVWFTQFYLIFFVFINIYMITPRSYHFSWSVGKDWSVV